MIPVRWIGKQLLWQPAPDSNASAEGLPFVETDDVMWDPRPRTVDLDSLRGKHLWILAGSVHVPDSKKWSLCKGLILASLPGKSTFVRLGYVEAKFDSDTGGWASWEERGSWTTIELV